jgi:NAD(P)-dependent dehydrogenase (short-subunit alcohol dehydrogenase family)
MTIRNEIIWITGGSSGIGAAIARLLAEQGNRVIISGRDVDCLQATALMHRNIETLVFDVTDSSNISAAREQFAARIDHLDRVILNAGTCEYLDIDSPDWSMPARVMATNYLGAVNTLAACFDLLKRAPQPHIVGIGSQAIRAPFPRACAYGASKAALGYFLESLRVDLSAHGIDITHVLPGFVDTPLTRKNDFPMPFILSADAAAQRIVTALAARPREFAFPRRLSAVLWLARRFPRSWQRVITNKPAELSP